MAEVDAVT